MFLQSILSESSWTVAGALSVFYLLGLAIYRLYFSPVARFPGPKLAALTLWYEFYYDVVKRGKYSWEIEKMHQKYGPIVRINPYELHINDADYYDEIYSGPTQKREKWAWSAKMFGANGSMFGTIPHELHRLRRAALSPYFSKKSVMLLEPTIRSTIEQLCTRFKEAQKAGTPVELTVAYAALTLDIITEYAFAKPYGALARPDFAPEWPKMIMDLSEASHILKQFGWLGPLMRAIPPWLIINMELGPRLFAIMQRNLEAQIQEILDGENEGHKTAEHPTIFHELLKSDLDPEEKSVRRLAEEGQSVVAAGQVTTTHYLKTTTFHILDNPDVLHQLKAELEAAIPDPEKIPPLQQLERLPYLSAVVSEGFRRSYGVPHRLQRVSPKAPLVYHDWIIPPGTPVGMSSFLIHDNPKHFPEPDQFKPERWLKGGNESGKRLEKYLVNFSRGTRGCLGKELAYAEIYLTLATVFRRFDMKLYETTRADVDFAHDFFNPSARLDSKGARVVFV
ncbi:MAG: hypothetical protein M1816_000029 [Peltula sp. TS41687]|nr:MAG: hypothetical protein M1816_000029 [Peltula sp. TS41687]